MHDLLCKYSLNVYLIYFSGRVRRSPNIVVSRHPHISHGILSRDAGHHEKSGNKMATGNQK